jgi:hypothetical protein
MMAWSFEVMLVFKPMPSHCQNLSGINEESIVNYFPNIIMCFEKNFLKIRFAILSFVLGNYNRLAHI